MARKLQIITEMFNREILKVAGSYEDWTSFLRCASNNFKYDFADQVLIYAQRPDATACAEIEVWNKRMNRWVNRGATGIALLDYSGNSQKLRYVFDVSDTNSYYGYEVPRWKVKERYHDEIAQALINSFGEVAEGELESVIDDIARNMAEENVIDYISALKESADGSFLEDLDDDNIKVIFSNILAGSIGYMMMTRCGFNADDFYDFEDFKDIFNFNTPSTVISMGVAVSDIAEMGLREIEITVKNIQKNEQKRNRTFDVENGKTVINIQESEIVKKVFSLYAEGKTLSDIALMLTDHNVIYFRNEVKWNKNTISRMIENEKYIGNDVYPF